MKPYVYRTLVLSSAMTVAVLAFQNCQDFKISDEVLASEYEIKNFATQDESTYGKLMALDEFVGNYVSDRAVYSGTNFEKVANRHVSAYAQGSVFDIVPKNSGKVPLPEQDQNRGKIFLSQSSTLGNAVVLKTDDGDDLTSAEFSVLMVVKAPTTGQIFKVRTDTDGAQEVGITITGTEVKAYHSSSSGNVATVTGFIDSDMEAAVIGASFGPEADRLILMVNGNYYSERTVAGTPADLQAVRRNFELGGDSAGDQVTWGVVKLFAKRLGPYDLSNLSRSLAQTWVVPGVIDDISLRKMADRSVVDFDEEDPATDPKFILAKSALESKCASCHYHALWKGKGANYYFSMGLVVKGSPENSSLYYRMSASSAPALTGSKNMPLSPGPAVTSAEVDAIRDWIQNAL